MEGGHFYNLLYRFDLPSTNKSPTSVVMPYHNIPVYSLELKLKLHMVGVEPNFFKELFQWDMKVLSLLYMGGLTANESMQSFSFA